MEDGKCVSQYSVCVKREVPCVELRRVNRGQKPTLYVLERGSLHSKFPLHSCILVQVSM